MADPQAIAAAAAELAGAKKVTIWAGNGVKKAHAEERKDLLFHKMLLNGELPLSIGGGIGQSRLCMFFLRKAHIGEVQSSLWSNEMIEICKENNINLI